MNDIEQIGDATLYLGDCLTVMATLPDACVDLIAADLPYGTTYATWDKCIPMPLLWEQYKRLLRPNGACVLNASQPFTTFLISSNIPWFRCEWIWNKVYGANFANANKQPLKTHESVIVFAPKQPTYNPQKTQGAPNHKQGDAKMNVAETRNISTRGPDDLSGMKFPSSILTVPKHSSQCKLHPTQKPIALLDYFIRTYSNPGDVVMDNVQGSGTTGIAALSLGRKYIGIEFTPKYHEVSCNRIAEAVATSKWV